MLEMTQDEANQKLKYHHFRMIPDGSVNRFWFSGNPHDVFDVVNVGPESEAYIRATQTLGFTLVEIID